MGDFKLWSQSKFWNYRLEFVIRNTVGSIRSRDHTRRAAGMLARRVMLKGAIMVLALAGAAVPLYPQDLTPRAYLITPKGSHAVIVSSSFSRGQVLIDPTVPIEDLRGSFQVPVLGYYQSFDLLGRSANLTLVLPYAYGSFEGRVNGSSGQAYRSGLADARVRFALNLSGGPAMKLEEYVRWEEKRLIGASLTVSMPTGQYDPARLSNLGTNRWGFKPEIGFSRRWGHWGADWYFGAWFFTGNSEFYPGHKLRSQKPAGALEGHLVYYLKPRLWMSFDANFWAGNRSTIDAVEKNDQQRDSRVGGTVSIPVNQRQSVKFSYSRGAYVTVGGNFRTLSAGWQYSWFSRSR